MELRRRDAPYAPVSQVDSDLDAPVQRRRQSAPDRRGADGGSHALAGFRVMIIALAVAQTVLIARAIHVLKGSTLRDTYNGQRAVKHLTATALMSAAGFAYVALSYSHPHRVQVRVGLVGLGLVVLAGVAASVLVRTLAPKTLVRSARKRFAVASDAVVYCTAASMLAFPVAWFLPSVV